MGLLFKYPVGATKPSRPCVDLTFLLGRGDDAEREISAPPNLELPDLQTDLLTGTGTTTCRSNKQAGLTGGPKQGTSIGHWRPDTAPHWRARPRRSTVPTEPGMGDALPSLYGHFWQRPLGPLRVKSPTGATDEHIITEIREAWATNRVGCSCGERGTRER